MTLTILKKVTIVQYQEKIILYFLLQILKNLLQRELSTKETLHFKNLALTAI